VVFGTGDFFGGLATRRAPMLSVLVVSQGVGLVGMLAAALIAGGTPTGADLLLGAAGGLVGGAGVALLYRALATGTMALVAPVTGVVAAIVPVAVGIGTGERPALLQLLGIALAVVAVALLSGGKPRSGARLRGTSLVIAIGSGVGFGLFYIALAHTSAEAGLWPLVAARVASVTAFSGALGVRRERPSRGTRGLALMIATGVFDVTANALYVVAVHHGLLSIVAVLVSLYPASTVLWSLVFLGERLRVLQVAGVVLALGAVALITAG
jgi:drug/metabolite transporter (DMT)-like permease